MTDLNQPLTDNAQPALPPSVQALVDSISAEPGMSPEKAALLLEQSGISAEDLAPWQRFEHPAQDCYGRTMIHDGGSFELMLMSWLPGDMSAIHDHGYTMWGAVRIYGQAEHAVFEEREGRLSTRERCIFPPDSIVAVTHELVHQMGNIDQEPFVSLHLYGSQERERDVTADSRIFELDEGRIQITTGGAFFLLPESQVSDASKVVKGDFPTWMRHNCELLRRMRCIRSTGGRGGLQVREERLLREFNSIDTWQALRQELQLRLPRLTEEQQLGYIASLGQELVSATRLFSELHAEGCFDPSPEVLQLIGEIAGMLENADFVSRIAGE